MIDNTDIFDRPVCVGLRLNFLVVNRRRKTSFCFALMLPLPPSRVGGGLNLLWTVFLEKKLQTADEVSIFEVAQPPIPR